MNRKCRNTQMKTADYVLTRALIYRHRRMGRWGMGGHVPPPKFLRSGKKECKIRAKHKNFRKILICPEKFFVFARKLRDIRGNFCYVRKIFFVCPENIFGDLPPPPPPPPHSPTILGKNINVQFACSGKPYCAPPSKSRPIRACI
jgi:hypothetical protein